MSRMIGLRLYSDNPREAEALAVLEVQHELGYSTRQILTEALLRLAMGEGEQQVDVQLEQIRAMKDTIFHQISRLQTASHPHQNGERANLSEAFVQSIKTATRPGVRLDG